MHSKVLTEAQKSVLSKLSSALLRTDFYLAGGTALALHLGHRMSQDFDWFAPKIAEPEKLLTTLRAAGLDFSVLSTDIETCYITINDVQVSFLGFDYPLLQPRVSYPEFQIELASLDDIAAMKLAAIASRGSRRDFIDLHVLFTVHKSLADSLQCYQKKYASRDIGHVIRSLVYFENAEAEPELLMIKPFSWDGLKRDMEHWVRELKI
jgi:predicted nucleotidyltransferase component of viral defense system